MKILAQVTEVDNSSDLIREAIEAVNELDVLVGIPEEKTERKEGDKITNSELAFIQSHGVRSRQMKRDTDKDIREGKSYGQAHDLYVQSKGSPLHRIPPRPIIEPAIEDGKEILAEHFKDSAEKALNGNKQGAVDALKRAGQEGQNIVRRWFVNPKNRWAPNSPLTIKRKGSDNPLIDTGEMRKAITYVVRKKG